MTRREFIKDVNDFGELFDFCYENDIDQYVDDILDEYTYDEYINDCLRDKVGERYSDWKEISEWLSELPSGCDYYIETEHGFEDADPRFEDVKRDVLDRMDEDNAWEKGGDEDATDGEDDSPVAQEPFSVADLYGECGDSFRKIVRDAVESEKEEEDEESFQRLLKT